MNLYNTLLEKFEVNKMKIGYLKTINMWFDRRVGEDEIRPCQAFHLRKKEEGIFITFEEMYRPGQYTYELETLCDTMSNYVIQSMEEEV